MPDLKEYIEMIQPLWESRWLTNMGSYHNQLERKLKDYLEVPQLSLMVNGHMALELTIQAMGFPEGAEIITTPFTFVSTTHAIVRNRLKPVFCDIKMSDYTIDEEKIEELITEKTVAILPVHVYGNICNVKKIQEVADKYHLKVIYDAAHAFGEKVDGIGVGNFGDASVFSFHATKIFHTIEGGAVTFRNNELYEKLYDLKNFGIHSEEVVAEVGANAKMNEFCAAMGLCNLKNIEENIYARRKRVDYYAEKLGKFQGIKLCEYSTEHVMYSYGYFSILFRPEVYGQAMRNRVYDRLINCNIHSRKYFYPITADVDCYKDKYKDVQLKNARYVSNNILTLPLYAELAYQSMDAIINIIDECVEE